MDLEQKMRIVTLCNQELDLNPLIKVPDLLSLLEHIEAHNKGYFDFSNLEQNKWQRDLLTGLFKLYLESPHQLEEIKEQVLEKLQYLQNRTLIPNLPSAIYSQKVTFKPKDQDKELILLQTISLGKLKALYSLAKDSNLQDLLKEDIQLIETLERVCIRKNDGSLLEYCIFGKKVGGVTPKHALISLNQVKTQLRNLSFVKEVTLDTYTQNSYDFKLPIEGIIKFPKKDGPIETQREAIALNISRLLELDTTAFMTITHENQSALLIHFEEIRLLSDFSAGLEIKANYGINFFNYSPDSLSYTHYSTINPLGEGIQPNYYIEDFGYALNLIYLCSDPDAIGGHCQNKGLKNNKSLFIFDQSIDSQDNFSIDARLCIHPCSIRRHSRHYQGRNRTLFDDSSFDEKFKSLVMLQQKKRLLVEYMDILLAQLNQRKGYDDPSTLKILIKDAEAIKEALIKRIDSIATIFPKTTVQMSLKELKQLLILEKLIDYPVLFNTICEGRPFRYPWTVEKKSSIELVTVKGETLLIKFKNPLPADIIEAIKGYGGCNSLILLENNLFLSIERKELALLHEGLLLPEYSNILNPNINYLASPDLKLLQKIYNCNAYPNALNVINQYCLSLKDGRISDRQDIKRIQHTREKLNEIIQNAKTYEEKAFSKHLLKKFHFDTQVKLQKFVTDYPYLEELNMAFSAALKLDRVSVFNHLLETALLKQGIKDPRFFKFLNECVELAFTAQDHSQALYNSKMLLEKAEKLGEALKLKLNQDKGKEPEKEEEHNESDLHINIEI